jgi:hypothetical protein
MGNLEAGASGRRSLTEGKFSSRTGIHSVVFSDIGALVIRSYHTYC